MPYLFGLLVAANVALFGYFWMNPATSNNASVEMAKSQLQKPMPYQNNTHALPPLIGEK